MSCGKVGEVPPIKGAPMKREAKLVWHLCGHGGVTLLRKEMKLVRQGCFGFGSEFVSLPPVTVPFAEIEQVRVDARNWLNDLFPSQGSPVAPVEISLGRCAECTLADKSSGELAFMMQESRP